MSEEFRHLRVKMHVDSSMIREIHTSLKNASFEGRLKVGGANVLVFLEKSPEAQMKHDLFSKTLGYLYDRLDKAKVEKKLDSYMLRAKYEPEFSVFLTASKGNETHQFLAVSLEEYPKLHMEFAAQYLKLVGLTKDAIAMDLMFFKRSR